MKIGWTTEAAAAAEARFHGVAAWKLVYDTEGCGCAVSGVPALWAVDGPGSGDEEAETTGPRTLYERRQRVFFDDELRVSYDAESRSFKLASDGQIYTNRLALVDRRG